MLPFARNESTRFISPTKTPEYLAAGRPVVSTSIRDVVHPYGELGLVQIADDAPRIRRRRRRRAAREDAAAALEASRRILSQNSWDRDLGRMVELIDDSIRKNAWPAKPVAGGKTMCMPSKIIENASGMSTSCLII